tara:strand:+ start:81 stop:542 length:462 start_codon:yes stop_codon:yes gene_type:complete
MGVNSLSKGTVKAGAFELGTTKIAAANRLTKTVKATLSAAVGAGGVLAWQNPESSAILVTGFAIDITATASTSTQGDFGPAANATTTSDTLIDSFDLNAAVAVADCFVDAGTNGAGMCKLDAADGTTDYITGTLLTGFATSMTGTAYITYVLA